MKRRDFLSATSGANQMPARYPFFFMASRIGSKPFGNLLPSTSSQSPTKVS